MVYIASRYNTKNLKGKINTFDFDPEIPSSITSNTASKQNYEKILRINFKEQ